MTEQPQEPLGELVARGRELLGRAPFGRLQAWTDVGPATVVDVHRETLPTFCGDVSERNAELIAFAVNNLSRLLGEVERAGGWVTLPQGCRPNAHVWDSRHGCRCGAYKVVDID